MTDFSGVFGHTASTSTSKTTFWQPASAKKFLIESGWAPIGEHYEAPDKYVPDIPKGLYLSWEQALAYETFQRFTLGTMR